MTEYETVNLGTYNSLEEALLARKKQKKSCGLISNRMAENLGVKNSMWDKKDGYFVPRNAYNSYFYPMEDQIDAVKRFKYHGKLFTGYCDGGSALHNNLDEHLTQKQNRMLLDVAAKEDTPYFTFNIPNTICNDCGHISKNHLDHCEKCGSKNVDWLTRVIGYLKRISNFSPDKQKEAEIRYYDKVL